MNIVEIMLGVVTIVSAVALTAGVVVSKSEGKGLSATIGGVGAEMQKGKASIDKTIDKAIMASGAVCGVSILVLGIIAAHM